MTYKQTGTYRADVGKTKDSGFCEYDETNGRVIVLGIRRLGTALQDLTHLTADLAKLVRIRETQPKRWHRHREQYSEWQAKLEARIAEIERSENQ